LLPAGEELEESGDTSDDEQEVGEAAEQDGYPIWLADVTGVQRRPELDGSALDEMGDEEAEAVPGCGDDDSSAESPWVISASEQNDSYIDERLQEMEGAKRGNEGP